MADIYFDPTYTGTTKDGGLTTPYDSWTGRTLTAGNRYLQRWGTTFTGGISPLGTGGTVGSRIVIGVYEPITGAFMDDVVGGAFVDATGQSFGINITSTRPYITVTGFEVYGATSANVNKASTSSSPSEDQYFWLENCILRDSIGAGADLRGKGNRLRNTTIHGNATDGAFIIGDDVEIGNSHVYNNGLVGDTGDGVQFLNSSNFYVHDSIIDHSLSGSKQAFITNLDTVPGTTGGRVINTVLSCPEHVAGVTLADQKTLLVMTPGVSVKGCTILGGQFGAYMQGANGVIEDCLLVVTGSGSVVGLAIRAAGIAARRNTVIGRDDQGGAYGIDHSDSAYTSTTIYGNAVKGWARGIRTTTSGFLYSHNAFENCGVRNANVSGTEGTAGTGDVVGSLGLSSSYVPAEGSAVDGVGLHLQYATDRARRQRFNPPSIGAFEPIRQREART